MKKLSTYACYFFTLLLLSSTVSFAQAPAPAPAIEVEAVAKLGEGRENTTTAFLGNSYPFAVQVISTSRDVWQLRSLDLVWDKKQATLTGIGTNRQSGTYGTKTIFAKTFNYTITPLKAGKLQTPKATFEISGQEYSVEPLNFTCEKQNFFELEITPSSPTVAVSQPFSVAVTLYARALPEGTRGSTEPTILANVIGTLEAPWLSWQKQQLPDGLEAVETFQDWAVANQSRERRGFRLNNITIGSDVDEIFNSMRRQMRSFGGMGGMGGFDDFGGFGSMGSQHYRVNPQPQKELVKRTDQDGVTHNYWKYTISRSFRAKKPGKFTFGPARGAAAVYIAKEGKTNPQPVELQNLAKAIAVEVITPASDPNAPASYSGAIGDFSITANLRSSKIVRVEEPMELEIEVQGTGLLERMTKFDITQNATLRENFKVVPNTKVKRTRKEVGGQLIETARFFYTLRPIKEKIKEIPPLNFTYYLPESRKFKTTQTKAIPITVQEASAEAKKARRNAKATEKKEDENLTEVWPNKINASKLTNERLDIPPRTWATGFGAAVGSYLIALFIVCLVRRRNANPQAIRSRNAVSAAKERLAGAASLVQKREPRQAAEATAEAITELVADVKNLPAGAVTAAEVVRHLVANKAAPELVEEVRSLLNLCDAARYGGAASGDVKQTIRQAGGLLGKLKKALALLLLGMLPLLNGCGPTAKDEAINEFQAANTLYQQAKTPDQYRKAAEAFGALLHESKERPGYYCTAVLYNQGNAYQKAGDLGRSIAAYRRAEELSPGDSDLLHNLYLIKEGDPPEPASWLQMVGEIIFWKNWCSTATKYHLAAIFVLLTLSLAMVSLFSRGNKVCRIAALVAFVFSTLLVISAAYDTYRFDLVERGVVVADEATAFSRADATSEPALPEPLDAGTEFLVRKTTPKWIFVQLQDGTIGCLARQDVELY